MKHLFLAFLLLLTFYAYSNDTIVVMQYNLLYYGQNNNWCNDQNNDLGTKNLYIRTILNEVKPDILTVCEFGKDEALLDVFLDNNLNVNGINSWKSSSVINNANSNIINAIFYNSDKLRMKKHSVAQSYLRDIDVFEMYFNTDGLVWGDTIDLICVVAHLKSSSGTQNENKRKLMIENTLEYLEYNCPDENILLMGDFNFYSSDEEAYQLMTDSYLYPRAYFVDPLVDYAIGHWHNNSDFQRYHTQSTNLEGSNCGSGGGLDDRFDFIMMSPMISAGTDGVKYVNGSYCALGQDGKHFNNSVNAEPYNTELSKEILDALYHNSDHLPVLMRLDVNANIGVDNDNDSYFNVLISPNPAKDILKLYIDNDKDAIAKIMIFNILGENVLLDEIQYSHAQKEYYLDIEQLRSGMYFVNIMLEEVHSGMMKLIVE